MLIYFACILCIYAQVNTFQGIVITNGYQSYTIFTYHCGSLEWSGNAVIGFRADKNLFQIHQLSGSDAKSIACQKSPRSLWNNVVYQLCKQLRLPFAYLMQNGFRGLLQIDSRVYHNRKRGVYIAILLHNGTVLLLSNKCFSKGHEPGNGDIVNTVHSEIGYSPSSVVLLRR